jgi:hypothetical protein
LESCFVRIEKFRVEKIDILQKTSEVVNTFFISSVKAHHGLWQCSLNFLNNGCHLFGI